MTKFISIFSGKGGVGKTTTAINLAYGLMKYGRDVVVVDANLTTPNINIHLGSPQLPNTLNDVMTGKALIKDAIYKHKSGIKIVPSSLKATDMIDLDLDKLGPALKQLDGLADIVILDGAAGLGEETLKILEASDEVLIISNPELAAISGALKTINAAKSMKKVILGVVLTKFVGDKFDLKEEEITEILDMPIIARIPSHDSIRKSIRLKHPVTYLFPENEASKEYDKLSLKLLGQKRDFDIEPSLFFNLLRKLGIKIKR